MLSNNYEKTTIVAKIDNISTWPAGSIKIVLNLGVRDDHHKKQNCKNIYNNENIHKIIYMSMKSSINLPM